MVLPLLASPTVIKFPLEDGCSKESSTSQNQLVVEGQHFPKPLVFGVNETDVHHNNIMNKQ
jgi:hypothetical protein